MSDKKMNDVTDWKHWIKTLTRNCRSDDTLATFAQKTGLSMSYLSDIEHGRCIPTIETLSIIFNAGGKSLALTAFEKTSQVHHVFVLPDKTDKIGLFDLSLISEDDILFIWTNEQWVAVYAPRRWEWHLLIGHTRNQQSIAVFQSQIQIAKTQTTTHFIKEYEEGGE